MIAPPNRIPSAHRQARVEGARRRRPGRAGGHPLIVGLLQTAAGPDPKANLSHTLAAAEKAIRAGARIVCTPELFRTLYFCQSEDPGHFALAEPIPGPTTTAFQRLARRRQVVIIAAVFERRAPGLYHNSAVIIDADGALLGVYRKMHIPDDPLFYEKYYFTPGDTGFRAWQTRYGKVGVLICWDQWYPEAARLIALQGAEILFYPTAIGWHPREKAALGQRQAQAWETIQRAHAIANGCHVAAVNRVGWERPVGGDGLQFWGQSFVAGPFGEVLAKAGDHQPETLLVPVDLRQLDTIRTQWPFLRDRRIDAYAGLTRRFLD